jgi:uncharacterized protein YaaW (UPF0174 family)
MKKRKIIKKEKKEIKALSNKDILMETIEEQIPERLRSFDIDEMFELAGLKRLLNKEKEAILTELKKKGVLIHKSGIKWVRAE